MTRFKDNEKMENAVYYQPGEDVKKLACYKEKKKENALPLIQVHMVDFLNC